MGCSSRPYFSEVDMKSPWIHGMSSGGPASDVDHLLQEDWSTGFEAPCVRSPRCEATKGALPQVSPRTRQQSPNVEADTGGNMEHMPSNMTTSRSLSGNINYMKSSRSQNSRMDHMGSSRSLNSRMDHMGSSKSLNSRYDTVKSSSRSWRSKVTLDNSREVGSKDGTVGSSSSASCSLSNVNYLRPTTPGTGRSVAFQPNASLHSFSNAASIASTSSVKRSSSMTSKVFLDSKYADMSNCTAAEIWKKHGPEEPREATRRLSKVSKLSKQTANSRSTETRGRKSLYTKGETQEEREKKKGETPNKIIRVSSLGLPHRFKPMWGHDRHTTREYLRKRLRAVMESMTVQTVVVSVIFTDLSLSVLALAKGVKTPQGVEIAILGVLCLDIACRMLAEGSEFWFGRSRWLNVFELIVVIVCVTVFIIESESEAPSSSLRLIGRVIRVCRPLMLACQTRTRFYKGVQRTAHDKAFKIIHGLLGDIIRVRPESMFADPVEGNILIFCAELKTDTFEDLYLPATITGGFFRELRVSLPLLDSVPLMNSDAHESRIKVSLSNSLLLLGPCMNLDSSEQKFERTREFRTRLVELIARRLEILQPLVAPLMGIKQGKIKQSDSKRSIRKSTKLSDRDITGSQNKLSNPMDVEAYKERLKKRLIRCLLSSLHIEIVNFEVRYEDIYDMQPEPFACGVKLGRAWFKAEPADPYSSKCLSEGSEETTPSSTPRQSPMQSGSVHPSSLSRSWVSFLRTSGDVGPGGEADTIQKLTVERLCTFWDVQPAKSYNLTYRLNPGELYKYYVVYGRWELLKLSLVAEMASKCYEKLDENPHKEQLLQGPMFRERFDHHYYTLFPVDIHAACTRRHDAPALEPPMNIKVRVSPLNTAVDNRQMHCFNQLLMHWRLWAIENEILFTRPFRRMRDGPPSYEAEDESKVLVNDDGAPVRAGNAEHAHLDREGRVKYYCGRMLRNGRCGPYDGPQCGSCQRFQASMEEERTEHARCWWRHAVRASQIRLNLKPRLISEDFTQSIVDQLEGEYVSLVVQDKLASRENLAMKSRIMDLQVLLPLIVIMKKRVEARSKLKELKASNKKAKASNKYTRKLERLICFRPIRRLLQSLREAKRQGLEDDIDVEFAALQAFEKDQIEDGSSSLSLARFSPRRARYGDKALDSGEDSDDDIKSKYPEWEHDIEIDVQIESIQCFIMTQSMWSSLVTALHLTSIRRKRQNLFLPSDVGGFGFERFEKGRLPPRNLFCSACMENICFNATLPAALFKGRGNEIADVEALIERVNVVYCNGYKNNELVFWPILDMEKGNACEKHFAMIFLEGQSANAAEPRSSETSIASASTLQTMVEVAKNPVQLFISSSWVGELEVAPIRFYHYKPMFEKLQAMMTFGRRAETARLTQVEQEFLSMTHAIAKAPLRRRQEKLWRRLLRRTQLRATGRMLLECSFGETHIEYCSRFSKDKVCLASSALPACYCRMVWLGDMPLFTWRLDGDDNPLGNDGNLKPAHRMNQAVSEAKSLARELASVWPSFDPTDCELTKGAKCGEKTDSLLPEVLPELQPGESLTMRDSAPSILQKGLCSTDCCVQPCSAMLLNCGACSETRSGMTVEPTMSAACVSVGEYNEVPIGLAHLPPGYTQLPTVLEEVESTAESDEPAPEPACLEEGKASYASSELGDWRPRRRSRGSMIDDAPARVSSGFLTSHGSPHTYTSALTSGLLRPSSNGPGNEVASSDALGLWKSLPWEVNIRLVDPSLVGLHVGNAAMRGEDFFFLESSRRRQRGGRRVDQTDFDVLIGCRVSEDSWEASFGNVAEDVRSQCTQEYYFEDLIAFCRESREWVFYVPQSEEPSSRYFGDRVGRSEELAACVLHERRHMQDKKDRLALKGGS